MERRCSSLSIPAEEPASLAPSTTNAATAGDRMAALPLISNVTSVLVGIILCALAPVRVVLWSREYKDRATVFYCNCTVRTRHGLQHRTTA